MLKFEPFKFALQYWGIAVNSCLTACWIWNWVRACLRRHGGKNCCTMMSLPTLGFVCSWIIFNISLIIIICLSVIDIQSLVHDIKSKQILYKLAYLTLTFDLVILTLGQLQHLNVINHMCKYHQNPIIGWWYKVGRNKFSTNLHIWPWPLIL